MDYAFVMLNRKQHNATKLLPFYSHYTGQPALASTPVRNWSILEYFVGAKFYCLHALDSIQIREKMLEFSSVVTCTVSNKQ